MNALRSKFINLKKNKENTKLLVVELMKISTIDFSIEHATYKLYKYGFSVSGKLVFKWMVELCNSGQLIFNGYKPEKVEGRIVGYIPIFGLIKEQS